MLQSWLDFAARDVAAQLVNGKTDILDQVSQHFCPLHLVMTLVSPVRERVTTWLARLKGDSNLPFGEKKWQELEGG